jgi:chemotaxis protein CheC
VSQYTDLQLDALRELANIGSGTASTALSSMLGRSVDITVPSARVMPMGDAVESLGVAESEVVGIVLGVVGEMPASVLLLLSPKDASTICGMLGVEADSDMAESAQLEIGNIVGTSYVNAFAEMTGMALEPTPPSRAVDMLAAIVQSVLAQHAGGSDGALLLDSELVVEGSDCTMSFLLVPEEGGVEQLLARLGL